MRFWILGLLCGLLSVEAQADYWFPSNQPRIFSSESGDWHLRVVPVVDGEDKGESTASFFNLNRDGSELKRPSFHLVNTPMRVLIPEKGVNYFVTLDTWANLGFAHSVVIYDSGGRVLHDLTLEDVLSPSEINQHVRSSVSSRWWREEAMFTFETPVTHSIQAEGNLTINHVKTYPEKTRLNISFKWGKKISIELATGKVVNAA